MRRKGGLPHRLKDLLAPRTHFQVNRPKLLVAQALWDYAEDDLCERALHMTDDDLAKINRISAWYENPEYPLPLVGHRITHNHVAAFAAITLFEGQLRPLKQSRRRPAKRRPAVFQGEG